MINAKNIEECLGERDLFVTNTYCCHYHNGLKVQERKTGRERGQDQVKMTKGNRSKEEKWGGRGREGIEEKQEMDPIFSRSSR